MSRGMLDLSHHAVPFVPFKGQKYGLRVLVCPVWPLRARIVITSPLYIEKLHKLRSPNEYTRAQGPNGTEFGGGRALGTAARRHTHDRPSEDRLSCTRHKAGYVLGSRL